MAADIPKPRHGCPSPCADVCILDEYGYCSGCHRTMDEVMAWPRMNDAQRRQVLINVERRIAARTSEARKRPEGPSPC